MQNLKAEILEVKWCKNTTAVENLLYVIKAVSEVTMFIYKCNRGQENKQFSEK